ncbi:hypothetical protein AAMO2058_000509300 [Amorphochlora amoebiformis]
MRPCHIVRPAFMVAWALWRRLRVLIPIGVTGMGPEKPWARADYGPDFDEMEQCIKRGSIRDLKRAIRLSGDINPNSLRNKSDGRSLLMVAAQSNKTRTMEYLLARSSILDVTAQQFNGFTALHYAAWKGSVGASRLLLEAGADPARYDTYGIAPLHKAVAGHEHARLNILPHSLTRKNKNGILPGDTCPRFDATCLSVWIKVRIAGYI